MGRPYRVSSHRKKLLNGLKQLSETAPCADLFDCFGYFLNTGRNFFRTKELIKCQPIGLLPY